MTIKHRIFLKSYKRISPARFKDKHVYKKFLGVKTLGIYKADSVKLPKKIKKIKQKSHKKRFFLKPYLLNSLNKKLLQNESKLASKDISKFMNYVGNKNLKEIKNFRAFLPKEIWGKMSASDRQAHLKKRRELQSKGILIRTKNTRLKISKNLVKFSNRGSRPLVQSLSTRDRRAYLKSFVQKAKFIAKNSFLDRSKKKRLKLPRPKLVKRTQVKLNINNIKKSIKIAKVKANTKKQVLKNLTYMPVVLKTQKSSKIKNNYAKK